MLAQTDSFESHITNHSPGRRPQRRALLSTAATALALSLLIDNAAHAAAIVYTGGEPESSHFFSYGSEITDSDEVVFQIGVFYGVFVPTPENVEEWEENWRPIEDSNGQVQDSSTTPLHTIDAVFDTFMGFSDSVELDHNNDPFAAGRQGYLWGYNAKEGPDTEWFLVTDEDWNLPSGTGVVPTPTWSVTDSDGTAIVVGSLVGASMTFQSVTIAPAPVPEPTAVGLIAAGGLLALRRRRPVRKDSNA